MIRRTIAGVDYKLPNELNEFQSEMYVHLINWKWKNICKEPGISGNLEYDAILPDACVSDGRSPLIYPGVAANLGQHRKKNKFRIHRHFYHMASSQAANVNLFLPILHHPNVDQVLGRIKPDFSSLAKDQLDNGYCIEFWGGNFEGMDIGSGNAGLLGDKAATSGTDSDMAIAYRDRDGELCLWLIEHKLTEDDFTTCGGFRSRGRQSQHDCDMCFSDIVKDKKLCYYHDVRKFNYWKLTEAYQAFFSNHTSYPSCPFRGGMNQLWRNQLLALAIEQDSEQPYKRVTFSVVKHPANTYLDATLDAYRHLIAASPRFSVFTSIDVIDAARATADETLQSWIDWYRDLYRL